MTKARIQFLQQRAKMFRTPADENVLRHQINEYRSLAGRRTKPSQLNLDATKLAHHKFRVDAWLRGERIAPVTIDMAMTQKCSYACTFCYAGLQANPSAPVPWEVYDGFLEDCTKIGHEPGEGVKAISLVSDGESTENPYYCQFIKTAKSRGIDVASGTNGLRLKQEELPDIVQNLTYLRFNFNARHPERYAAIMGTSVKNFHRVVANIKEAVRLKRELKSEVTIGLQMVLLPEYADEVLPLALFGRELGVDYTIVKHCSDDSDGRLGVDYSWYTSPIALELLHAAEDLSTDDYSVQVKWSKIKTGKDRQYSKCFGTVLHLQMSGTGLVAPCGSFFNERYKDKWIGDIRTHRFRDIWAGERYWAVLDFLKSEHFDPRKECALLCLQENSNKALFDLVENGTPLPEARLNHHVNFL